MATTSPASEPGGNSEGNRPRLDPALPAAGEGLPEEPRLSATPKRAMRVLVVDIGGTKIKILATGQTEPRKAPSGRELTPARLVEEVRAMAEGWDFEVDSIGSPG